MNPDQTAPRFPVNVSAVYLNIICSKRICRRHSQDKNSNKNVSFRTFLQNSEYLTNELWGIWLTY